VADCHVIGAMKRTLALLLGMTVLAAACAASPGGSPGEGDGSGDSDGSIDHPTGDALVLSVENRGGFVPVEFVATAMPTFTLLGDGRVIVPGAMTLIYPGPALAPLQHRTLTEEGIQQLLAAVAQTGLFDADLELRGAQNIVADAADTVFTLHAGDRDVTVTVYGLGTLDPSMPMEGVSAAEANAHRTLTQLNDRLMFLDQWLPASAFADDGWKPYEPEAFRLYVRNADAVPPDPALPPEPPHAWPVEGDPAAFGEPDAFLADTRCGVVEGEEAAAWLEELSVSTQLTRWAAGDHLYTVLPRPLLPHEERVCPEASSG
jgi:hypothetical protein